MVFLSFCENANSFTIRFELRFPLTSMLNRNNNGPPQAKKKGFILQYGLSKLFPEVFREQLKPKSEMNYLRFQSYGPHIFTFSPPSCTVNVIFERFRAFAVFKNIFLKKVVNAPPCFQMSQNKGGALTTFQNI